MKSLIQIFRMVIELMMVQEQLTTHGKGLDGKLRLFLDLQNCKFYPNLTKKLLINFKQKNL